MSSVIASIASRPEINVPEPVQPHTPAEVLERGYTVVMYQNEAGQFLAVAVPPGFYSEWVQSAVQEEVAKDHEVYGVTPEEALRRLGRVIG